MTSESQRLRERGAQHWEAAVTHPMVREIGDGTLPHETFRFYFEQNVEYLHDYARAVALTIAGVTEHAAQAVLTRFLAQIVEVEIPANLDFLETLGGQRVRPAPLLPTAYAYTRHVLDAARADTAVALAALLPCQWSYGEIGRRLLADGPPADPIYARWIGLFAGDGYGELVGASTDLLDNTCARTDPGRIEAAFDRSTRYEIAFWEMAYTRGAAEPR
ncbi:TenA family protein [Nocardia aurantia]|uniref:Aminopyrimidine aminohydrolase n=1 Tax=Nocardia aurantia TaxID=2585199 RepID=A0A7K0DJQ5_9NOCA|nr:hypothetical protein [Nocardia aurantia]MQY25811.1 Aminopyrimidine aminohydrolase [Nocardia aurantia]